MNLLAPVNRNAFPTRGRLPFGLGQPNSNENVDTLGQSPLDPADLLSFFAGISALGLAHLASHGYSDASNATASAATNLQRPSTDLARRRYVSGIADQFGSDDTDENGQPSKDRLGALAAGGFPFGLQDRHGSDEVGAVLPAVLHGSTTGTDPQHLPELLPVQFRSAMEASRAARLGAAGIQSDEHQKRIALGLMGIWKSIQERAHGPSDANGGQEGSGDTSGRWLIEATPLRIILDHILEMSRKSGGRNRKTGENTVPFKLSPSITPPEGPDSNDACVKAANGTELAWENYCRTVADPQERAVCWDKQRESAQNKIGWCASRFAD